MADDIRHHDLTSAEAVVRVLSLGAAVQDWRVHGQSVVLGFANPEDYRTNPHYLGTVVGRVANRTARSGFMLEGGHHALVPNDGPHHLHGGPGGLSHCNWDLEPVSECEVVLRHVSPDGDQGYPGEARFELRLTLEGTALTWDMRAEVDRATPINLAQHLYFNLTGGVDIRDHQLRIAAERYTPVGPDLIPTGEQAAVAGTWFDFREMREITAMDPEGAGYDHNFVLHNTGQPQVSLSASNGLELNLTTNRPGLQVYNAGGLSASAPASGVAHAPFAGICLEAQDLPNALNQPGFGDILCRPGAPYHQRTTIDIRKL